MFGTVPIDPDQPDGPAGLDSTIAEGLTGLRQRIAQQQLQFCNFATANVIVVTELQISTSPLLTTDPESTCLCVAHSGSPQ